MEEADWEVEVRKKMDDVIVRHDLVRVSCSVAAKHRLGNSLLPSEGDWRLLLFP